MTTPLPDPRFRELSPELLAALSPDELPDAVVHHVQFRLNEQPDVLQVLEQLPVGIRTIFATWAVDAEVCNGGFNQFFYNRDPALAGQALAAYELLGAEDYADVMRAAIATWEVERDGLARFHDAGTLEAFSESYRHTELGAIDQRYYALADRIYTFWSAFVRDRPELFRRR
jgi:hypothetical protein